MLIQICILSTSSKFIKILPFFLILVQYHKQCIPYGYSLGTLRWQTPTLTVCSLSSFVDGATNSSMFYDANSPHKQANVIVVLHFFCVFK